MENGVWCLEYNVFDGLHFGAGIDHSFLVGTYSLALLTSVCQP